MNLRTYDAINYNSQQYSAPIPFGVFGVGMGVYELGKIFLCKGKQPEPTEPNNQI